MFERLARGWSPYGHEPARKRALRRRWLYAILAIVGFYFLSVIYLSLTADEGFSVRQIGGQGGPGDQRTIDTGDAELQPPIRVTLRPGFASYSTMQNEPDAGQAPQPRPRAYGFMDWLNVAKLLGLYGTIYVVFTRVAKNPRGKLGQVNLGVYKGAMPYELHSWHLRKKVFSATIARYSLALIRKADYYARIAPDHPSLFWDSIVGKTAPRQAPVIAVERAGKPPAPPAGPGLAGKRARPAA